MDILETTKTVIDGKVVVELPHSLDNQDVKIIVSKDSPDEEEWANLPAHKRVEILETFYDGDKFPNVKLEKKADFKKFSEMSVEERLSTLKQYQGTAKYPDADVSKYDVYEQ